MKTFLIALVESVLTAGYWWLVVTISFGLFGGSRDPASPPPGEGIIVVQTIGTIVIAIVAYALLSIGWRKLIRPRLV
ncbi:hypothetical protein [Sphingomonas parapaucimobilis]|jgi:hypothetical protein|uniref:Uncharacterized protein n=1 Tax=Sphingomonas parapaucimobilis NBRC 15100 TaxID=1219049 RepID=A0A0A1W4T2_9SPHN|nr:hypothetical protein [Sphingomonas parapaucimobilis]GAM00177.1 hypothetical protein SP5_024_00060 [Sphingomonas parapaucimobilis NBRC 15100]